MHITLTRVRDSFIDGAVTSARAKHPRGECSLTAARAVEYAPRVVDRIEREQYWGGEQGRVRNVGQVEGEQTGGCGILSKQHNDAARAESVKHGKRQRLCCERGTTCGVDDCEHSGGVATSTEDRLDLCAVHRRQSLQQKGVRNAAPERRLPHLLAGSAAERNHCPLHRL